MFFQIFLSPQVKQCVNITYTHGIYLLRHQLLNKLKNLGIIRKYQYPPPQGRPTTDTRPGPKHTPAHAPPPANETPPSKAHPTNHQTPNKRPSNAPKPAFRKHARRNRQKIRLR